MREDVGTISGAGRPPIRAICLFLFHIEFVPPRGGGKERTMRRKLYVFTALVLCMAMLCPYALAEETQEVQETQEREEIRYGEPISYGPTLEAAYTERSLTSYEDGRPITLVSVSGATQAIVQVIDINAEEIIHTFYLDFTGYCYNGCVTNDGVIYFNVGNKVVQYDPRIKEPVLIGTAPTNRSGNINGLIYDEEEKVLWGTVNFTGNLFRCNPETKEMRTFATLSPEVYSVGKPDILGDYIYIGGAYAGSDGAGTHIYRVDKETGEMTALPNPNDLPIKTIDYIYAGGKYIFANLTEEGQAQTCYIWDTEQEEWVDKTFHFKTSGMTDIHEGKYYFLWDNCFHSIDVETLEIVDYPDLQYGSHLRGNGFFIEFDHPDFPGYSFLTAQYNGNIYIFNTQTSQMKRIDVMLTGSPLENRISHVGCDDRVYVMGFKGSNGVVIDPETGEKEYYAGAQGEGFVSNPETGMVYHGDYSGALIYEMDSTKPYSLTAGDAYSDTNPKLIADLDEQQDRPFGMDIVDNKLVIGTLSEAKTIGGALSVIDLDTYQTDIYRNIIPGQSILSVTHKDNIVYASTTVTGGTNSTPTEKIAHVFSFDINTREIVKDVEIKIPGINGSIVAVHGLEIGPDGMLYGAVAGAYFVMDPETLEVVRQNVYGTEFEISAGPNSQYWHEYYMQFDPMSGYLFITGTIVDPETLEVVCGMPEGLENCQFSGLDSKGNAYFTGGDTTVYKVPVIRGEDKSYLISNLTFFREGEGTLYRNGTTQAFESYSDNNRIMVPLRATATAMGGTVAYDGETKTVTLTNQNGQSLSFKTDGNIVSFDGVERKFGVSMKLIDGYSYIPLQTLCDFLGRDVYTVSGISFIYDPSQDFSVDDETIDYILSEVYNDADEI